MLTRTAGPVTVSGGQVCGGTSALVRPNNLFGWGVIDALEAIHPSADADMDGVTDPCDCAPDDGGAFDLPREIGALAFDADRATVRWAHVAAAAGPGTTYNVVRGGLADLAPRGGVAGAGCLASGLMAPEVADPESPAAGEGFFYLVAARNGCGTGGWGRGSNDTERLPGGCP
jgi:hypothetical protein